MSVLQLILEVGTISKLGSDAIPFSSVVKFIHCCYQLDCLEVFSLLANVAIEKQITSIKILSLVDELRKHEIESKKG